MRPRSALLAAALLALAGCTATPLTAPAGPTRTVRPVATAPVYNPTKLAAPSGKYLGIAAPGLPESLAPLSAFGAAVGVTPDLVEEYSSFSNGFDASGVRRDWQAHALTLVAWEPYGTTLRAIAAGEDDAYITAYAKAVRALNLPIALSFGHEMNGSWYPWGTQAATPAQFVAAWRHLHDLFAQAGTTNVIWTWDPNVVNPVPGVRLAAYWPGAAYVTWVGITGYWTGQLGEDSWATLYGPTEREVAAFTSDPILITETGAESGPDKASWVADMMAGLRDDPRVIGLVYFDYGTAQGKRGNWILTSSSQAVAAYRAGAAQIRTVSIEGES